MCQTDLIRGNWLARVQRGVNSTAYRPGPLSQKREYNLDAFLRWYLRQLLEERG